MILISVAIDQMHACTIEYYMQVLVRICCLDLGVEIVLLLETLTMMGGM